MDQRDGGRRSDLGSLARVVDDLIEAQPGRVALLDDGGRVSACNAAWRAWCASAGLDVQDDRLETLLVRMPEHAELGAALEALLAGTLAELQVDVGRLDGHDEHFELHGRRHAGGGVLLTLVDVTRRHLAEEELRLERRVAELMALAANLHDSGRALLHTLGTAFGAEACLLWERSGDAPQRCVASWVSPRVLALGARLDGPKLQPGPLVARVAATGKPLTSRAADDLPAELAAEGIGEVVAFPIARGARRFGVIELFAVRLRGEPARMLGTLKSLGERIALSAERFRAEQALRDVIDNAPDALLMVSADGRVVMANNLCEDLTLVPRDALVGMPVDELLPEAAREAHVAQRRRFTETGRARHMGAARDLKLLRADGAEVPVDISLAPIETVDGPAVLAAIRDVSERRAREAEAQRQRRHEALAHMAAGIADDLAGPLEQLEHALGELGTGATPDGPLARAHGAAASISEVVAALDRLSGPHAIERSPVDLNTLVRTTLTVSRHEWKPVARVVTELDGELPRIDGHEADLTHALFELVLNAAHAVGARGERGERGDIAIRTRRHDGWVEVEIQDSGIGMSPQVQAHLYEPFFSTKPPRVGRGMGLALVKSVVEAHGGELVCDSREGHGTSFRLRLPVT